MFPINVKQIVTASTNPDEMDAIRARALKRDPEALRLYFLVGIWREIKANPRIKQAKRLPTLKAFLRKFDCQVVLVG